MSTAFYVAMLLGVTWLMVWAALSEEVRRRYWWPFEFSDNAPGDAGASVEAEERPAQPSRATLGWRARAGSRQPARAGDSGPARRRLNARGRRP